MQEKEIPLEKNDLISIVEEIWGKKDRGNDLDRDYQYRGNNLQLGWTNQKSRL